jgi:light-regulated signal transduction histidine kinase (bacteriophytochrome)
MVSDISRVLTSLMVSKKDKSELEDAIEHMEKIQRRTAMTARDAQRNIDDIMEAVDSLLSITSADISEIRLMMDALLEVWIGNLILFPSP